MIPTLTDGDDMSTSTNRYHATTTTTKNDINSNDNYDDDDDDDDILHDINKEQLENYKQMLLQLGEFPDKILINTLSMIAEDYSTNYPKSCLEIYNAIKSLLLAENGSCMKPGCKLPLVYVVDSILKNAKGLYIDIMQDDFISAMDVNTDKDGDNKKTDDNDSDNDNNNELSKKKLRKVWNTWDQFKIFPKETWKQIGQCFLQEDTKLQNAKIVADAKAKAAGIERSTKDGTLQMSKSLRKYMQKVLDEIQADQVNELDKVGLERLADINPDLLVEIKNAAEELMVKDQQENQQVMMDGSNVHGRGHGHGHGHGHSRMNMVSGSVGGPSSSGRGSSGGVGSSGNNHPSSSSSMFEELRSPTLIQRCEEWDKLNLNHRESANDIIKKLLQNVRLGTMPPTSINNPNSNNQQLTTNLLGAASATANHLTTMLERSKTQDHNRGMIKFKAGSLKDITGKMFFQGANVIDKSKFTSDGLKEKNDAVIARLYDGGLAFVSSADGRRFGTQLELSKHLDALFRKNQLEKSMERTDVRGWYESDRVWSGLGGANSGGYGYDIGNGNGNGNDSMIIDKSQGDYNQNSDLNSDPMSYTVTADESRDKCVVCGINFSMKFNDDEGEWKYENCKEIVVMNDDVAEKESETMFAHVTCLRGLGSPEYLTRDQVLITY
jgi:pre-mRNA cleavage complex 2 protein Pcf11